MELHVQRVAVHELMVDCVEVMRSMSVPKRLTVVTHCEPADAVVTGCSVRCSCQ